MQVMRFGNFEVLTDSGGKPCLLGGGAYGKTYKARHVFLNRIVALKVLHERYADEPRARERFLREAQAAHELRHPHIAEVLDFGEADGSLYYAMEFCSGGDLDAYVRKHGAVPPALGLDFARQIAQALGYAHGWQFLHRDLKPSNVMLFSADGPPVLKLIDFGLVKHAGLSGEAPAGLTLAGEVLGTPMFASPEQLREEPLDHRSDLFSLGMTLWYLLEGTSPIAGNSATVMAERLGPRNYKRLFSTKVPKELRHFLAKLIEKNPQDRFQSSADVIAELARLAPVAEGTAPATPGDTAPGGGTEASLASVPPKPSTIHTATFAGLAAELVALGTPGETGGSSAGGSSTPRDGTSGPSGASPHFRFLHTLGESVLGLAGHAEDLRTARENFIVRLRPDASTPDAWPGRLASSCITSLGGRIIDHLPLTLQADRDEALAVGRWTDAPRLMQVLQARGSLPVQEAALVLDQVATVIDDGRKPPEKSLDTHLGRIALVPLAGDDDPPPDANRIHNPLDTWPPFLVCLPAKQAASTFRPDHLDGDKPTVPDTAIMTIRDEFESVPGSTSAFAALAYRLVTGGEPRPAAFRARSNYRPVPNLSKAGNALLSACLAGERAESTCQEILAELLHAERLGEPGGKTATGTTSHPSATAETVILQPPPLAPGSISMPQLRQTPATPLLPADQGQRAAASVANASPGRAASVLHSSHITPARTPAGTVPAGEAAGSASRSTALRTWLALGAVACASVVIGLLVWRPWLPAEPTSPQKMADPAARPQVAAVTDTHTEKEPRRDVPPVETKKEPAPPVTPEKPRPPGEVVFRSGIKPSHAAVRVNGKRVALLTHADGRAVVSLDEFREYPVRIEITPPSGYTGSAVVLTNPKDPVASETVDFRRAEGAIAIQGRGDYDEMEATFLRPLPEEADGVRETAQSVSPVVRPLAADSTALTHLTLPTGAYKIRLRSRQEHIAPRTIATEWLVQSGAAAPPALNAPRSWAGTYECSFDFHIRVVENTKAGKQIDHSMEGKMARTIRLVPGLSNGCEVTNSTRGARKGETSDETYPLGNIRVAEDGTLTAIIQSNAEAVVLSFDEMMTLSPRADGTVEFRFMPTSTSRLVTPKVFNVSGTARRTGS